MHKPLVSSCHCSCRRTAPSPRPYGDASAEIFVLDFGLYKVSIVGLMSSSISCKKASSCAGPHIQAFFVFISSRSGCPISAILLENLPSWFTIPMNMRSSVSDCGTGS